MSRLWPRDELVTLGQLSLLFCMLLCSVEEMEQKASHQLTNFSVKIGEGSNQVVTECVCSQWMIGLLSVCMWSDKSASQNIFSYECASQCVVLCEHLKISGWMDKFEIECITG